MRGPLRARRRAFVALDAVSLALAAAVGATAAHLDLGPAFVAGAAAVAISLACLALVGGYRMHRVGAGRAVAWAAGVRLLGVGVLAAALLAIQRAVGIPEPWLAAAGAFAAAALVLTPAGGALLARLLSRGWGAHRVLLIGDGPLAERIAEGVARHRERGLRVAGFLGEEAESAGRALGPHLGTIEHLEKLLRELAIERVVVTVDAAQVAPVEDVLVTARLAGIAVESGADCFEWLFEQLPLDAPPRQLFLEGPGFRPPALFDLGKRACDLCLGVVGLLLTAPVIALAALAIRLESPGPVLFRQVRVGRGGRPFALWKLRSMRMGAEPDGPALTELEDPRVTRVGRVLRRSRIDELPQLWNVLRGEMSIVGPRPERPEFYDELAGRYPLFRHRLAVRPGLTGWAQVQQGYVNDWEGFGVKLSYDLFYLRRRGVGLDAKVMWRTLRELLQLKGV